MGAQGCGVGGFGFCTRGTLVILKSYLAWVPIDSKLLLTHFLQLHFMAVVIFVYDPFLDLVVVQKNICRLYPYLFKAHLTPFGALPNSSKLVVSSLYLGPKAMSQECVTRMSRECREL